MLQTCSKFIHRWKHTVITHYPNNKLKIPGFKKFKLCMDGQARRQIEYLLRLAVLCNILVEFLYKQWVSEISNKYRYFHTYNLRYFFKIRNKIEIKVIIVSSPGKDSNGLCSLWKSSNAINFEKYEIFLLYYDPACLLIKIKNFQIKMSVTSFIHLLKSSENAYALLIFARDFRQSNLLSPTWQHA